jgi:hypothetical protein
MGHQTDGKGQNPEFLIKAVKSARLPERFFLLETKML